MTASCSHLSPFPRKVVDGGCEGGGAQSDLERAESCPVVCGDRPAHVGGLCSPFSVVISCALSISFTLILIAHLESFCSPSNVMESEDVARMGWGRNARDAELDRQVREHLL